MIKVILWDIDGTLLNFEKAEKYALKKCFSLFDIGECTDDMVSRYSAINKKYWELLETGKITKAEVMIGRFRDFFELENISINAINSINEKYRLMLSDKIYFNDNGYELVKKLKNKYKQYAVTNGTLDVQSIKLEKSGLVKLFDDIFISDKIGAEKPSQGFFNYVLDNIGRCGKNEILIIGDSLTSDIQGGNNSGILCCWYNPAGCINDKNLRIDYEIQNLWQINDILESIK